MVCGLGCVALGLFAFCCLLRYTMLSCALTKEDTMTLREWLEQTGVTQRELARRVGVSRGAICRLLSGQHRSSKLAEKVSKATGGKVTPGSVLWPATEEKEA